MMSIGHVRPADEGHGIDGRASPERVPLTDEDAPVFAVWSLSACRSVRVFRWSGRRGAMTTVSVRTRSMTVVACRPGRGVAERCFELHLCLTGTGWPRPFG